MVNGMYRIGIVGATSLVGKEMSDELQESLLAASDFVLFDEEEAIGQVASVGDEAAFIQRIEASSFDGMDFVFFCGEASGARKHWQAARKAGASVIDLTFALEGEEAVPVRAPGVNPAGLGAGARAGAKSPGRLTLETTAVVTAHPAAVMLAIVATRLQSRSKIRNLAMTLFEPASQHGRKAMDELHQQTVNLLSFQSLPREQYDAQVAFNLLPSLGEAAKASLRAAEEKIQRHYALIAIDVGGLPELALQLVQAPVFHGYAASLFLELDDELSVEEVEQCLAGESIDVVAGESDPPSNLSAAGQEDVMVRVRSVGPEGKISRRFWVWLAADNLKFHALNGIACANELRKLRPRGKVQ